MTLFLKVLNKYVSERLQAPKLFLIIDLPPLEKLLELLAINHSSSKRRIIFGHWLLNFSDVLVVLELAWVRTSRQFSWIARSGLAPFPGYKGSSGIVKNGPVGLILTFNIHQSLKY